MLNQKKNIGRVGIVQRCVARSALFIAAVALMVAGCGDDNTPENKDCPAPVFENHGDVIVDPDYKDTGLSGVEALQNWNASVVYGEVLRVEPVTDRYEDVYEDEEWVPGTTCDGALHPALRVHLRVKDASWPAEDGETIVLGLHTQRMHAPVPEMRSERAALSWSDDQCYFGKGILLGATGKFDASGLFVPDITFFSVDAEGHVELPKGREDHPELSGQTLEGLVSGLEMSRDEVFKEHLSDAWGELKSECLAAKNKEGVRDTAYSGENCELPEHAGSRECLSF